VTAHAISGKQVHDARLAAIMEAHGVASILTFNTRDFSRYPGLTATDPAAVS
jgi:predicted nucleic acid-binding protein